MNSLKAAYEKEGEKGYNTRLEQVKGLAGGFYDEYNAEVDQQLFQTLMAMYIKDQDEKYHSPFLKKWLAENGAAIEKVAAKLYKESILYDEKKTMALLGKPVSEVTDLIKNDKAVLLQADLVKTYSGEVAKSLNEIQARINKLNRTYMQAQMDVFKEKTFYPDANSTLRVTFGNVKGYNPRDAVKYDYYTYLDGVLDKYKPGDYEFDVPEKIRALYKNKDYGQYGSNGKMPVCFIAMNHTTGGNSGSPALDAYGNLVGLNFDRVWEGTMSDINYDASICRNIMVDIRYVLFIVDKYAGAGHLVKEMKLVHPKKK
jgi:Peptidase S46